MTPAYVELQVATNFSFLRGASHPHEYIWRAAELGYSGLGITDYNSLAGIVRAHTAARDAALQLCVGCRIEVDFQGQAIHPIDERSSPYQQSALLLYPKNAEAYGVLCALLTQAKSTLSKNDFFISLDAILQVQDHFAIIIVPPFFQTRLHTPDTTNSRLAVFYELCRVIRENSTDPRTLSIALTAQYSPRNRTSLQAVLQIARSLALATVATNDVHYHAPERKPLQDTLTAIRLGCTVEQAGFAIFQNSERYLKSPAEMLRLFRDIPGAISRTLEIAEISSGFSLSSLRYTYPREIIPDGEAPEAYLRSQVYLGARQRFPHGVPDRVVSAIEEELTLIHELEYEKYFLTCYDIVSFARRAGILCQGRGAAANSVVCFCLGITAVNPQEIDLLFARFISKERREPPDIDIDFEHERREEVIQYIYSRYGRNRAALTAEVVTFQARSAVRAVAKALGLSLEITDTLAQHIHRWTDNAITSDALREIGLQPFDPTIQNVLALSSELIGFPRHLSQHVGGFIISDTPLTQIVPIINAGMENRTIIEWDKNDIEELGMLKIDILALGMLTCIRKALGLINSRQRSRVDLYSIPPNDQRVYDMLCASDTVGVFQVESRAQMSMLPRLKPRCFYDLVIQVAIVRPGPIQGNMVHPFIRRRNGLEKVRFPDTRVEKILGKTLGVPIFQEQAMRLAITLANFTPGEAEKLRRAMAAWKSHKGVIAAFKEKIVKGMCANGYSVEFAETCLHQIKGFSEYGFPESHAASFALLVYASAWIKRHYPAEFACALLNSQPMGFYAPAQIIRDAQRHGVNVKPIDTNHSSWDCRVDYPDNTQKSPPTLRLGLRLIRGIRSDQAQTLAKTLSQRASPTSIHSLWNSSQGISHSTLATLANANAFTSLGLTRREALWNIRALPRSVGPLDSLLSTRTASAPESLPRSSQQQEMFKDYATTGFSLHSHPLQYLRPHLTQRKVFTADQLSARFGVPISTKVSAAGMVIIRQRPGTAKGVVFITLEDETGSLNLIIRPTIFDKNQKTIMFASIVLASGALQRTGEVVYIDVDRLEALDTRIS
jgi:error-prone DNA polymerase